MDDIRLGDLVQDKVTGFKGIVIAKTLWLNQCTRVYVQPRELNKDGEPMKPREFDMPDLTLLEEDPLEYERRNESEDPVNGGPRPEPTRRTIEG